MVSNARDDLPEPLRPVMTTSLSRGIWSVRFLRLCSRAPPILMNSLLTDSNFPIQTIGKFNRDFERSKGEPKNRGFRALQRVKHRMPASGQGDDLTRKNFAS